jgi:hypothetical protein
MANRMLFRGYRSTLPKMESGHQIGKSWQTVVDIKYTYVLAIL